MNVILASDTEPWMAAVTTLALLAAMAAVAVSAVQFMTSIQPDVVVYAAAGDPMKHQVPAWIYLVVENIGKGAAWEVRFSSDHPIQYATGGTVEAPFKNGIPFLPPGGNRSQIWGNHVDLIDFLGDNQIKVTIEFDVKHRWWWSASPTILTECILELASFKGLRYKGES